MSDILHYNLIKMYNDDGVSPGLPPKFWKEYTENVSDQIEEIIDKAYNDA